MYLAWRTIGRSETFHRFLRGILGIVRGRALPLRAPVSARKWSLIGQHTGWTIRTAPPAGWCLSGVASGQWPGISSRVGGAGKTSGVGCAIPVWRQSMPCSGVPTCVPVRPGSSSSVHSCLKSTSTARMPHCRKTNDTLLFWWCIRKNVPARPFAATGTDRTVAAASSGNHNCLSSGTTTSALALQPCMCWSTTVIICGDGKQKPKHAFAEPGMWLTSWPSTSMPAVPSVWYHE